MRSFSSDARKAPAACRFKTKRNASEETNLRRGQQETISGRKHLATSGLMQPTKAKDRGLPAGGEKMDDQVR
jgi:hypothetical protein